MARCINNRQVKRCLTRGSEEVKDGSNAKGGKCSKETLDNGPGTIESNSKGDSVAVPNDYLCPIDVALMVDPVV